MSTFTNPFSSLRQSNYQRFQFTQPSNSAIKHQQSMPITNCPGESSAGIEFLASMLQNFEEKSSKTQPNPPRNSPERDRNRRVKK